MSQHLPAEGIQSAFGGEHWAKIKIMMIEPAKKEETARKERVHLRHLLGAISRPIRIATEILPVAMAMIQNV